MQNLVVTEDEDGMRLDRWFKRRIPTLALSHLAKICRKGEVRLDGKRVETSSRVAAGQKVRVPPLNVEAPKAPAVKRPEQSEADARAIRDMILLDDRDLMVLNKPYGLAVQGGSGTKIHLDGMLESLADARGERPVLVHRLDRDTSGVLLIAKTRKMAADLGEIFRSRRRQEDLLGAGGRRAEARRRAAFRFISPRARAWGILGATTARGGEATAWRRPATSRKCASPNTAMRTPSIR